MDKSPLLITYGIDPEHKLLYSKWKAPYNSEQLRESLQHLAEVIHNNQIELWLHETLKLNDLTVQDQKWTTEVLALILSQTSLKYFAVVRPEKPEAKSIGNTLREKAYRIFGRLVGIEFFNSIEEAKAWLVPKRQYYKLPAIDDTSQKID